MTLRLQENQADWTENKVHSRAGQEFLNEILNKTSNLKNLFYLDDGTGGHFAGC